MLAPSSQYLHTRIDYISKISNAVVSLWWFGREQHNRLPLAIHPILGLIALLAFYAIRTHYNKQYDSTTNRAFPNNQL